MNSIDTLDVQATDHTRHALTQDATTIGQRTSRHAPGTITPIPAPTISYRLISAISSAFPIYVDAHAPSPHPPTLSPLIAGTCNAR